MIFEPLDMSLEEAERIVKDEYPDDLGYHVCRGCWGEMFRAANDAANEAVKVKQAAELQAFADKLGLGGNLPLAAYIRNLEQRIAWVRQDHEALYDAYMGDG